MKKYSFVVSFLVFGFMSINVIANTTNTTVPEPFRGFDDNSKLTIDYRDLDSLLDTVVLNTGRSDRKKAARSESETGTRMKVSINRATANEGNRFFYEVFNNNADNQKTIAKIQNRLESIPKAIPLEKFSRDEQLAYWINLYNITILKEIVHVYPERKLEDLLVGKDSILSKKTLMVAGVSLSLNDIQFAILKQNYGNNPLVIYGLYQGIIGGPNIRKSAYTGKYVYADLIDNAMEFVNSNRGTDSKNAKTFRVSSLYERNAVFFPDFTTDLSEHLLTYLEGNEVDELKAASKIKTDIDDWTITDLYGSSRDLGGTMANNSAALVGAVSGGNSSRLTAKSTVLSKYNPAALQQLNAINQKKADQKSGTVTIEEMGQVSDEPAVTDKLDNGSNKP